MNATQQPIRFAGGELGEHRHACAFFRNPDEEYQVLLPFIKEGILRGEKAFHIVDPALRADHLQRLQEAGIDTTGVEQTGQLEVRRWEEMYLRGGHFDQDAMLGRIEEALQGGMAQGYALTRLVAHMEWALEDRQGVNDLVEYEARLNYCLPKYDAPVICTYDSAKFGTGTVLDVLRAHPMVVIGGILQRNPFFVPPDEFLKQLRERASYSSASGEERAGQALTQGEAIALAREDTE